MLIVPGLVNFRGILRAKCRGSWSLVGDSCLVIDSIDISLRFA